MSLTNPNLPVTEERLKDFYEAIKPYLGGGYSAGDGIEISNGEISTDNLQSGDMDDVVTPLPAVTTRKEFIKYSTDEQIVGEWIGGKPLYQKTITSTVPTDSNDTEISLSSLDIDTMVDVSASAGTLNTTPLVGYVGAGGQGSICINVFYAKSSDTLFVRNISYGTATGTSLDITIKYTKTTD